MIINITSSSLFRLPARGTGPVGALLRQRLEVVVHLILIIIIILILIILIMILLPFVPGGTVPRSHRRRRLHPLLQRCQQGPHD